MDPWKTRCEPGTREKKVILTQEETLFKSELVCSMREERTDARNFDKDVYEFDSLRAYSEVHVGMEAATMEEPST